MKNRKLLENYVLSGDLERKIAAIVDHNNNHRHHEGLGTLPPAVIYHGHGANTLKMREESNKQIVRKHRL